MTSLIISALTQTSVHFFLSHQSATNAASSEPNTSITIADTAVHTAGDGSPVAANFTLCDSRVARGGLSLLLSSWRL